MWDKPAPAAETLKVVAQRLGVLRPPRLFYLETITDLQFSKRDFLAKCRAAIQAAAADARFIYASTLFTDFMQKYPQTKRCAEIWIFKAEFEMAILRKSAAIDTVIEGLKYHAEPMELLAEAYRVVTHGQVFSIKRAPNASIAIDKTYLDTLSLLCDSNKWGQPHVSNTSGKSHDSERHAAHYTNRSISLSTGRQARRSSCEESGIYDAPRPGQRLLKNPKDKESWRSMTPSTIGRESKGTTRLPIQYAPHEHVNRAEVTNYYTQLAETKRSLERRLELGLIGIRSKSINSSIGQRSSSTSKSPLNVPVVNKYQEVVAKSFKERVKAHGSKNGRLNRDRRRCSDAEGDFFDLTDQGHKLQYVSELSFELPETKPLAPNASHSTYSTPNHTRFSTQADVTMQAMRSQSTLVASTRTGTLQDIDSYEQMYGKMIDGRPQSASFSSVFSDDELPPISRPTQVQHTQAPIADHPSRISVFDLDKKAIPFLSSQVN